MSRWLKSVNTLLENLDGKAEEVVADTQGLQKIIAAGYPRVQEEGGSTDGDEDYYDDDDDYDDDYDDDKDGSTSEVEDEDEDAKDDDAQEEIEDVKEPLNYNEVINMRERLHGTVSGLTVSDISHSMVSDESSHDEKPAMKGSNHSSNKSNPMDDPNASKEDTAPQPPNRHASLSQDLKSMATSSQEAFHEMSTPTRAPAVAAATSKNPKLDESPRFPRRSLEGSTNFPVMGASLFEGEDDDDEVEVFNQPGLASPRQPTRIPSLSNSGVLETEQPAVIVPSSKVSATNPKASKEYQIMKDKFQALQVQLAKTTTELKTSQTQVQSLTTQTHTLETKLEAAHSELHAQSEELQRAGERMEKDRLRAKEEREDLLDEQEEELEQVHQTHKRELDGLRKQYESQISDLTNQLHTEETKRRQEGGDYTQELHDAIERERVALKQLNDVTMESTQLRTTISKFEMQQVALQTKLDAAVQSVKTANEREREAEDKLDASMTVHSRQMRQRQEREAELEKTIFELGTALTLARQKQPEITKLAASDSMGESFKDKFMAVADELETLKVQFHMETQRREALQEELNDISKERSEEASNAQARQRMQDRKVSDMELTISRLKSQIQEQRGKPDGTGSADTDSPLLSREVEEARRDVENLSLQLLRHQNMAENFKSEILALKGRLQAAVSRAEQAEKSLQIAQAPRSAGGTTNRLYEMEGGGLMGGMRRRVKGTTRSRNSGTISAALHMTPGRINNPLMEQVAMTLDALDSWMVETGSYFRHEPLARLAFMLYLIILHLWSFALVIFHMAEEPHADFGSLDTNPRHWRTAAVDAKLRQD